MCAARWVHIRYQFAFALTIDWKLKPRIHFHCSMILPVYFVVMRAFVSFFVAHFLRSLALALCIILILVSMVAARWIAMTQRNSPKTSDWFHLPLLSLLLLSLCIDSPMRLYAELKMIALGIVYPFWMSSSSPTLPFKYWFGWLYAICLFVFISFFALSIILIPIRLLCRFFFCFLRCANGNGPAECDIAQGINIVSLVYRQQTVSRTRTL